MHTTDWSDNVNTTVGPANLTAINGTYNRELLSARAASIIEGHDPSTPLYMYLAFQVRDPHIGSAARRTHTCIPPIPPRWNG